MNSGYYDMIFKRKSFHVFRDTGQLSAQELQDIHAQMRALTPLVGQIRTTYRIVPRGQTTCGRGEYCILLYSERKEGYLQNIGYLGGQLDLWLASRNIGACWYGVGKPLPSGDNSTLNGLEFVIMLAIGRADPSEFRKDYTKAKRKPLEEIWIGDPLDGVSQTVRFTPSACNTQPWLVERSGNRLTLYRVLGKRGMMPRDRVSYFNRIDLGIFQHFLELCLAHEGYFFTRELYPDEGGEQEKTLCAIYELLTAE